MKSKRKKKTEVDETTGVQKTENEKSGNKKNGKAKKKKPD